MKTLKLFLLFLILSLIISYGDCLGAIPEPKGYNYCKPQHTDRAGKAGALYFQLNDPTGNAIVISRINHDGSIKLIHMVLTNGKGHNYTNFDLYLNNSKESSASSSLLSQNSVIVGGNLLFVVNSGSNTISLFTINPENPLIINLVCVTNSHGDFPMSLAYSEKLGMLCVLNGGNKNGVQCFFVDFKNSKKCLNIIPPGTRKPLFKDGLQSLGIFGDILFARDSTILLVSVKAHPENKFEGFIASYRIKDRTIQGPTIIKPAGSISPFSLSIIPNTKERSVLFTDSRVGFGVLDLDEIGRERSSSMVLLNGQNSQNATLWSDCSFKTKACYTADISSGRVIEVQFNFRGGKTSSYIAKTYDIMKGMLTLDIQRVYIERMNREFLLILSPTLIGVEVMALKGREMGRFLKSYRMVNDAKWKCGITLPKSIQGMAVYILKTGEGRSNINSGLRLKRIAKLGKIEPVGIIKHHFSISSDEHDYVSHSVQKISNKSETLYLRNPISFRFRKKSQEKSLMEIPVREEPVPTFQFKKISEMQIPVREEPVPSFNFKKNPIMQIPFRKEPVPTFQFKQKSEMTLPVREEPIHFNKKSHKLTSNPKRTDVENREKMPQTHIGSRYINESKIV